MPKEAKKNSTTKKTKSSAKKTTTKSKVNAKKEGSTKECITERDNKKQIIKKHQVHGKDSGSAQVQVAILTDSIKSLTEHLKTHPKDDHSRRGLLLKVGKRRKLLNFLKKKSSDVYSKLISSLGLRR